MNRTKNATILTIDSGIVGLTPAIALRRKGFKAAATGRNPDCSVCGSDCIADWADWFAETLGVKAA